MQVPVVATRVGGVPSMLVDDISGLLVESGQVDALIDALARICNDPPLRARLAQSARHTLEQRYCFAGRMAKLARIYDELLSTPHE